jgi:Uma2 family endonuclease
LAHNPDTVRAPDAAFVSAARLVGKTRRGGFFEGAPDLAVEVASPNESAEEIQDQVIDYLSAGTRMVLYLHPRSKTITVYRALDNIRVLTLNDALDGGDVLPGFSVTLKEIFKD